MNDREFMLEALREAREALAHSDVPVGAVIVRDGKIISRAHNERELNGLATAHAEVLAIERACRELGTWRLSDCTLYVTLEPCPMCAGAILNARVGRTVFGAPDPKAGCMGSVINLNSYPFNYACETLGGVCAEESRTLLAEFFEEKRRG